MKTKKTFKPDWVAIIVGVGFVIVILSGIGAAILDTKTTQEALNKECKTNYSFFQVATSGDKLVTLCKIKNQSLTVK